MKLRPATSAEIDYISKHIELGDRKLSKQLGIQLSVVRYWIKRCQPPKPKLTNKSKKPISSVSKKMSKRLSLYKEAKEIHLKMFPSCQVCGNSEGISIHHIAGRSGGLLHDSENFITLCMSGSYHLSDQYPKSNRTEGCHPWVERNLKIARQIGLSKSKVSTQ